jgi:hypothetical protein
MRSALILLLAAASAPAHRLDEYLQGTLISVEKNRVQAEITLTPGVAVFPILIAELDRNGDEVISESEQRAYAARVLGDLSLSIDGRRLTLQVLSTRFAALGQMKDGLGEIRIEFAADLPPGGRNRRLVLENHHYSRIAAYQVNCLVPRDPDIRIAAQKRNYLQSVYQLEYVQAGVSSASGGAWLGALALAMFLRFAYLSARHQHEALDG